MTRTSKALGAALLAVCALGAVAASSASAVDKFTCTNASGPLPNCDITAEGSGVIFGFKSSSFSFTCKRTIFSGTAINNSTEITLTPVYEECGAPIEINGCQYIFTGETTEHLKTDGVTKETDAGIKLECSHTGSITMGPMLGCTLKIADTHAGGATVNQNLHGVTYDNEGVSNSTEDIKVTITIDNIAYTTAGSTCFSFFGLPATGTDTFITGSITAKGYTDNSPHGIGDHAGIKIDTP